MRRKDAPRKQKRDKANGHGGKKNSGMTTKKKRKKAKQSEQIATDEVLLKMRTRRREGLFLHLRTNGSPTYATQRAIVEGYRTLSKEMNATHFMTFMPGYFVKPEAIAANIVKFCCRLDRKALGKKWTKCKKNRIRLIGFLEKPDITPHYHAIVHVPQYTEPVLDEYGAEIWKTLMPRGKFEGESIQGNARRYSSKDLHHAWSPENVVIYVPISGKA